MDLTTVAGSGLVSYMLSDKQQVSTCSAQPSKVT